MQILLSDEWGNHQSVLSFLRDECPEERKAEVEALLAAKDWSALDAIMVPFFNIEQ